MVQKGQAVVYRQYLQSGNSTKNQFIQAEADAKSKKLGLWNQSQPLMPWDFRRGQKPTQGKTKRSDRHKFSNAIRLIQIFAFHLIRQT